MAFKPFLPPSILAPKSQSHWVNGFMALEHALRTNFQVSTWLLMGALLQSILVVVIPRFYALLPAVVLLSSRFANTLLITYGFKRNHYLDDAIPQLVAAQVPDEDGIFGDQGANQDVVIFLLGAKSNHPMGIFAPNFKEMGGYLSDMVKTLDQDKGKNGFLGASSYTSLDKNSAIEFVLISYWRSIDDIHKFAYGPLHREAWEWYYKLPASQSRHMGINHEIFASGKGQWEAIYRNFQPTLLGATTYLRKGDEMVGGTVPDQWIGSLVDATKGKLRSSAGRLGWQPDILYDKYQYQREEK